MNHRRIGLIGGLSWYSTADYYHRINQLVRQRLGGHQCGAEFGGAAVFGCDGA